MTDTRTLVTFAFKFKRRAITVFCACIALAAAASVLLEPRYQATASVLVKIGRELVYRADVGSAQGPLQNVDKDALIASNIAIMRSQSILEEVIGRIGLERLYPDLADAAPAAGPMQAVKAAITAVKEQLGLAQEAPTRQAVRRFDRNLSIAVAKKTGIIEVAFLHPDREIAAEAANDVVEVFQSRIGRIYDAPNLAFEENQVRDMRHGLERAEQTLNDYRQERNAFALSDQLSLLLKQRVDIDTKLKDTSAQIVQLQGLTAALAAQAVITPKVVPLYTETERHKAVDDATSQLMQLRVQEQQLATRFGSSYPALVELRNQIRAAQSEVSAQTGDLGSHTRTGLNELRNVVDQALVQNKAQLQSLFGARETLQGQVTTLDAQIGELSKTAPELARLERDVQLRADALKASFEKLTELRAVDGLNQQKPASFSLYEPATPADPADRARPLPLLYMLIGIVVGLFAALTTLFLSFRLYRGFLTPRQLAMRLDRPILAVVDFDRRLAGRSWPGTMSSSAIMAQRLGGAKATV